MLVRQTPQNMLWFLSYC